MVSKTVLGLFTAGAVAAEPATMLAALRAAIGDDGTLMAPTYTYDNRVFHPDTTPGRTGALSEALRLLPGAIRSWHPTHSVAAHGPDAAVLCADHHLVAATDVASPLGRLAEAQGRVLLVGVGHVADSSVHVGEFLADAPYLDIPVDPSRPRELTIHVGTEQYRYAPVRFSGCSKAFGAVEWPLRARGAVRDAFVGRALAQLVDGKDVVEATASAVRADPTCLLCTDPACYRCTHARARLSEPTLPADGRA